MPTHCLEPFISKHHLVVGSRGESSHIKFKCVTNFQRRERERERRERERGEREREECVCVRERERRTHAHTHGTHPRIRTSGNTLVFYSGFFFLQYFNTQPEFSYDGSKTTYASTNASTYASRLNHSSHAFVSNISPLERLLRLVRYFST